MPLGQCQIYGTERQGFTRTIATRVDQEQVFLGDFVLDLKLTLPTADPGAWRDSTDKRIVRALFHLPGRASFTSKAEPQVGGADQGRSSQFEVDERTDLGGPNHAFYAHFLWKLPN